MNSYDLMSRGFRQWHRWATARTDELLESVPAEPGVFIVSQREPVCRYRGVSDILYIGVATSAGGLKESIRRLAQAKPPGGRSKQDVAAESHHHLSWATSPSPQAAKALYKQLLTLYDDDHVDRPPWNTR